MVDDSNSRPQQLAQCHHKSSAITSHESLEDARRANERAHRATDHAQDAENRANEVEDRLEELEKNKENEPPRGRRRRRNSSSDSREDAAVCPNGFKENKGQAEGFYIPNDDGESIEPKYVRFMQGGTLHAEGTEGKGFPVYQFALAAKPDYEDTDLPLAQMPIWFTAALSRHNNMYNTILQAALQHNNWGICADIVRYRHTEDQIGIWEARAEEAAQRVERAREERTQARFRLEAARAHRVTGLFCRMPLRAGVTKFFLLSSREYTREGTRPYRILGELI
jgi:hypothetical protein